jgi:predicted nucleotidyltransferase
MTLEFINLSLPDIMNPSNAPEAHRVEIRDIVLSHRVINPWVFGSIARGLHKFDSDLDTLVDKTPETTRFDLGAIRYKLRQLLGV